MHPSSTTEKRLTRGPRVFLFAILFAAAASMTTLSHAAEVAFANTVLKTNPGGRPRVAFGDAVVADGIYLTTWNAGYKGTRIDSRKAAPKFPTRWDAVEGDWQLTSEVYGNVRITIRINASECHIQWSAKIKPVDGPAEIGFWVPEATLGAGTAVPFSATYTDGKRVTDKLSWDYLHPDKPRRGIREITFQTQQRPLTYQLSGSPYWMLQDLRPSQQNRGLWRFVLPVHQNMLRDLTVSATIRWADASDPGFTGVDLRKTANMAFRDDVADDQKGGWTDQGANDMRSLPVGPRTFGGIPFDIIDPETNDGRSCIVLAGKERPYFPLERRVAVGRAVKMLYFLHAGAWVPSSGKMGEYRVEYADGTNEKIDVAAGGNIRDWWQPKPLDRAIVGWEGTNGAGIGSVGLYVTWWENPHPEKTVRSLSLESLRKAVIGIVGVTTARAKIIPTVQAKLERERLPLPPISAVYTFGGSAHYLIAHNLRDAKLDVRTKYAWKELANKPDVAVVDEKTKGVSASTLRGYVESGGALLVSRWPPYPPGFEDLLPVKLGDVVDTAGSPAFLVPKDLSHPAFSGLPWDVPHQFWPIYPVTKFLRVTVKPDAHVLAAWNGEHPALIWQRIKKGKVIFLGTNPPLMGGWASSYSSHEVYFWSKLLYWATGREQIARQLGALARAHRAREKVNDPACHARVLLENAVRAAVYLDTPEARQRAQKLQKRLDDLDARILANDQRLIRLAELDSAETEYQAIAAALAETVSDLQNIAKTLRQALLSKNGVVEAAVKSGTAVDIGSTHISTSIPSVHSIGRQVGEMRFWVTRMLLGRLKVLGWNIADSHSADLVNVRSTANPDNPLPEDFDFSQQIALARACREDGYSFVAGSVPRQGAKTLRGLAERSRTDYFTKGITPFFADAGDSEAQALRSRRVIALSDSRVNFFDDRYLKRRAFYLTQWARALDKHVFGFEPMNEGALPMSYAPQAVALFQYYLRDRFQTVSRLNHTLRTRFESFDAVQPPKPELVAKSGESSSERALFYEWTSFRFRRWEQVLKSQYEALRQGTDKPIIDRLSPIPVRQCVESAVRVESHGRWYDAIGAHCQRPFELDYSRCFGGKPVWLGEYYWTYWGGSYRGLRHKYAKDWLVPDLPTEEANFAAVQRNLWRAFSRGVTHFRIYQTGMPTSAWGQSWAGPMTVFWPDFTIRREAYALKYGPLEYQRIRGELEGSKADSPIALIEPLSSIIHTEGTSVGETAGEIINDMELIHRALEARHLQCDPLPAAADLSAYPAAIISAGVYLARDRTERLLSYVRNGGALIAAGPLGQFDEHSWPDGRMLYEVWGVEKVERLSAKTVNLTDGSTVQGPQAPNLCWRFLSSKSGVNVMATWPDGTPAALRARYGKGAAVLVGWTANTAMGAFIERFVAPMCSDAFQPIVTCDNPRVRLFVRKKGGQRVIFAFNEMHTSPEVCHLSFESPKDVTDLRIAVTLRARRRIELNLLAGDCRVLLVSEAAD